MHHWVKIKKQTVFYFSNLSCKQKLLITFFDSLTVKVPYLAILPLNCLPALYVETLKSKLFNKPLLEIFLFGLKVILGPCKNFVLLFCALLFFLSQLRLGKTVTRFDYLTKTHYLEIQGQNNNLLPHQMLPIQEFRFQCAFQNLFSKLKLIQGVINCRDF